MLCLTRKAGQAVTIGAAEVLRQGADGLEMVPIAPIEVTVLEIKGKQVRLGVTAPRTMPIHRGEVWARIQAEREAQAAEARA